MQRNDTLLDAFLFETKQMIERAEIILIECEKAKALDDESINEIFRIMHTVKGSSAMMEFRSLSEVAHKVEDLFAYIRQYHPPVDYNRVGDIVLAVIDFMKNQIEKIENGEALVEDHLEMDSIISAYLEEIQSPVGKKVKSKAPVAPKPKNKKGSKPPEANCVIWILFDEGCEMESIRAFNVKKHVEEFATVIETNPKNLDDFEKSTEIIRADGFEIFALTHMDLNEVDTLLRKQTVYLKDCKVTALVRTAKADEVTPPAVESSKNAEVPLSKEKSPLKTSTKQNYISVNVAKLDKLMDIVGELVISEVMVTRNPEIMKYKVKSFMKAATQLKKMTTELQDIVMSIRMVPISATFYSMQRIVRDMSRKLGKEVELVISGEETEVDKNIIDSISDPLMHLIRNAIDHGIEDPQTRISKNKPSTGKIFLEARNEGGDVWITVRDDGKGLNREAILKKAKDNNLLTRDEKELSDKDIWSFILMPGFSTKQAISEFSGRGVGMDVVMKNIEKVGGRLSIDSFEGKGSIFSIKIPLTLAIIDGMEIAVGNARYTIPLTLIKEAFRPKDVAIVYDSDHHEAIMLRGECIEIMRLHQEFDVQTNIMELTEGILIIVQNESKTFGIFADRLIGEHQVVVKPVPEYMGKIDGVSGCTILGDGSISLILDVAGLMDRSKRRGKNG